MTTQTDNAVDNLLLDSGEASDHKDGTLRVSPQHVCKSHAGFYVGQYCIEIVCEQWLPQPYSRDSEYFGTEGEAQALLDNWRATA